MRKNRGRETLSLDLVLKPNARDGEEGEVPTLRRTRLGKTFKGYARIAS